jgi:predicted aspartyl protease
VCCYENLYNKDGFIWRGIVYAPEPEPKTTITTASGIEHVSRFVLESIKIGEIELQNISAYAHKFPEESFSIGVIGLNVLQQFDIELLFSKQLVKLTSYEKED